MEVRILDIKNTESRRQIDRNTVEKLAESMRQVGLLNPVTIDWGRNLIAGAHRVAAAKQLGWSVIPCTMIDVEGLQAKLAELDENLVRNQGSVIEQGEWLAEKKRIYEELHPETKQGGDRGNQYKGKCQSEINSFCQDTAEKTGLSKRTIEQSIQIAENLTPEVKEFAKEVDLNKTNALELARKEPEEQRKIIEPIRSFVATVAPEERKETAHRLLNENLRGEKVGAGDPVIAEIERVHKIFNTYNNAVLKPALLFMEPEHIAIYRSELIKDGDLNDTRQKIDMAVENLKALKEQLTVPSGGYLS